jgi:hypothetical protein
MCAMLMALTLSAGEVSNSFSKDPEWEGLCNTENGNDFGYRGSSMAGNTAGEIGGVFARTNVVSHYGDAKIGALTLDDSLQASGKFLVTNANRMNNQVQIGYRSIAETHPIFLGISIVEGKNPHEIRISAMIALWNEKEMKLISGKVESVPSEEQYSFQFSYDPKGGANQQGRLSLSIRGAASLFEDHVDLTAADRMLMPEFDLFGMGGVNPGNTDESGEVYLDDVTYTSKADK